MTFRISLASDWEYERFETFNSLEELQAFSFEEKHNLVIDFYNLHIIVYDDYIE